MIQDGELLLIDMPEVTMGPPICDLVSVFRNMISAPNSQPALIEQSVGMPAEMIMNNLLRPVVIPNAQTICELYKMPV